MIVLAEVLAVLVSWYEFSVEASEFVRSWVEDFFNLIRDFPIRS